MKLRMCAICDPDFRQIHFVVELCRNFTENCECLDVQKWNKKAVRSVVDEQKHNLCTCCTGSESVICMLGAGWIVAWSCCMKFFYQMSASLHIQYTVIIWCVSCIVAWVISWTCKCTCMHSYIVSWLHAWWWVVVICWVEWRHTEKLCCLVSWFVCL